MLTDFYHIRNQSELSIRQLSIRSGLSKTKISKLENGKYCPRLKELCRLAKALKRNPEELFSILISNEIY